MLMRILKAGLLPIGSVLFVGLFLLLGFYPGTRFLYMGIFFALPLAVTFLVALFISIPGVSRWMKNAMSFLRREKGFVLACMVLFILVLVGVLLFLQDKNGFITDHKTELFLLVVLPGFVASPYLVGSILYRIKEWWRVV